MVESLDKLICSYPCSLQNAVETINNSGLGICFIITHKRELIGVLSDGDVRRALLKGHELFEPVDVAINKNFVSCDINSSDSAIGNAVSKISNYVPLIDENNLLVDFASPRRRRGIPVLEPRFSGNELEYLTDCVKSGWISSQGQYIGRFEKEFEKYFTGTHALSVSNGTTALHLALAALGIKEGDEVILPTLTFAASANAVIYCGATPVFCDVDESMNMDLEKLKTLVSSRTKAILIVHLYGRCTNMRKLSKFCKDQNLLLVEDCAESFGTSWDRKLVGTYGDAATFSFFGNKTITTGEGGMVLFKQSDIAQFAKTLRDHGMSKTKRYWHEHVGFNYRMTNMQAAVGLAQIERSAEILQQKRAVFEAYREAFENCSYFTYVANERPSEHCSNWLFVVVLNTDFIRDNVMDALRLCGIDSRPVFYPLHTMPPYLKYKRSNCELAENMSQQGICLPSSATLTKDDLDYICVKLLGILS